MIHQRYCSSTAVIYYLATSNHGRPYVQVYTCLSITGGQVEFNLYPLPPALLEYGALCNAHDPNYDQ